MKLRKKKKKDTIYKYNTKKSILILIMLICMIIAMITYWIYAYHHKYGKFYFEDIKLVSYKISDYVEIKGDQVYLKNIDEDITKKFEDTQRDILKKNVSNIEINKGLFKNILSLKIDYTISDNLKIYEEVLILNIDIQKNQTLDNDELLKLTNVNYKSIATNIFNNNIKLPSDSNIKIIDSITEKEMSVKEFNDNSEKYIIRIREKLPEILKLYIEDNTLYGIVRLSEIDKICYYTDSNDRLVNIKVKIGKI